MNLLKGSLLVIGLLGLVGCQTIERPPVRPGSATPSIWTSGSGIGYPLKEVCARRKARYAWDPLRQVGTIWWQDKTVQLMVDSPIVLVDDDIVVLSRPVFIKDSVVMVGRDFMEKVFGRPRPRPESKPPVIQEQYVVKKIRRVIIDPGHGGKDPGAIGRAGVKEKDVVLDIALRLDRLLRRKGFKVRMTRDKDVFVSLKKRTEIASRSKADLFISIHANSSPSRGVRGLEIFTLRPLSSLEKKEEQRRANQRAFFDALGLKPASNKNVERMLETMLYEHKQAESAILAKKLGRDTARGVKSKIRGVKQARFYVLRNTVIPAILVEVGFLTNTREEKLLKQPQYRQKIAGSLAESLWRYARP